MKQITFAVTKNDEDPEVGGYFAYDFNDYMSRNPEYAWQLNRGFGHTVLEAIACYCAVEDLDRGNDWGTKPTPFC